MNIKSPKAADMPGLRELWKEAFGDTDEFLDRFWHTAYSPERCRCIQTEDKIVAALYWFDCECRGKRVAYLYAVATAPEFRGQGFCKKLMEQTHIQLKAAGYSGAVLVPGSQTLFSYYRRLGYQVCGTIKEWYCEASEQTISLRRIDSAEYSRLRRQMLPEGAVLQEKESEAFLQTQAELYAAQGILLAARCQEDTLFAVEYLGDENAAAGIVKTLNCTKGIFRGPGEGKDFAMYLPLDGAKPPEYFGLAFD